MKTKLLLCKNVDKLGIVGDVVHVAPGYARNYLVPQGLATEPNETNMRALAEARRIAEQDRLRQQEALKELCEKLEGVEITLRARANEDGVLYGSVGRKEIADALEAEGYPAKPDQIVLSAPIRHLDNVTIELKLSDGLSSNIKVWVVRDKTDEDEDGDDGSPGDSAQVSAGMEASTDDHRADE